MSIHGEEAPKIITSGSDTINLDYVKVIKDEEDYKEVISKSKVEGIRTILHRGYHYDFHLKMHLYKYGDPGEKYIELKAALGDTVTLYRHRDGDPCKNPDGDSAGFVFIELIPFHLTEIDFKDGLILKFMSTEKIGSIGS